VALLRGGPHHAAERSVNEALGELRPQSDVEERVLPLLQRSQLNR
jgi:hypothetical protein